jgi:peptide/nickel transport system permease protein
MLKQYPTLRFVLMRAGWYFLTFLVAVTINFYLPRLGKNNPVDIIMGKTAAGSSAEDARQKEEKYLKEFGLVKVGKDGELLRTPVADTVTMDTVAVEAADKFAVYPVAAADTVGKAVTYRAAADTAGRLVIYPAVVDTVKADADAAEKIVIYPAVQSSAGGLVIYPAVVDTVNKIAIYPTVVAAGGKPIKASRLEQFGNYIKMCFMGDLGTSFQKYPKKVIDVIKEAVPWTIALQLPTILFGWIVGNVLGALAAYRRGVFDKVFFPVALVLSSFPFFVFGMLLVYCFAILFPWFPPMGGYDLGVQLFSMDFFASAAYHYVLPFFSIFLILAGGQAIGMRSMGIYELGTDYIKYAKWLGLKEGKVLAYLFRNAMLPQITGLALSLGTMIGGALITEMIFSYPGLGMAMLTAIQNNDYPMIQGCTLIITVSVLIANFTVDILIGFLDPRVKAGLQMGKGG